MWVVSVNGQTAWLLSLKTEVQSIHMFPERLSTWADIQYSGRIFDKIRQGLTGTLFLQRPSKEKKTSHAPESYIGKHIWQKTYLLLCMQEFLLQLFDMWRLSCTLHLSPCMGSKQGFCLKSHHTKASPFYLSNKGIGTMASGRMQCIIKLRQHWGPFKFCNMFLTIVQIKDLPCCWAMAHYHINNFNTYTTLHWHGFALCLTLFKQVRSVIDFCSSYRPFQSCDAGWTCICNNSTMVPCHWLQC
jgi:hypothetical protein